MVASRKSPERGVLGAFKLIQIDDTHIAAIFNFLAMSYDG